MNPEQVFKQTFERLLQAGWLKQFRLTDGKGWHLVWTETGTERAMELKRVILACGMLDDTRTPHAFTICAQRGGLGRDAIGEYDPELGGIWLAALRDLRLDAENEDGLLGLVHTIIGWS